ncbi:ABC transporter permease [Conexibacter woesei]|uniref:Binding-protein-dependent transport systems inner membrane component n=1 Tax=Conexibacter woesei (strain DSM 14684 / CCUG 47730 / CIP 108061 / JCM 11494 / NBRC 100937 / ID131577) TaxID=469383 RepID=D3FAL8_CONWI|nr:ABC transporter permease [Conexibacter woesei]ADB51181.1 binding-protein-dependent transport systems inner membrane component [Conexibacter woesei DSM 14684]
MTLKRFLPTLIAIAVVLGVWIAVKAIAQPSDDILPSPLQVWDAAVDDSSTLLSATKTTLVGAFGGFVVGNVAGILLAMTVAASQTAARVVLPIALVVRVIPVIALAPFLTLVLGTGNATIVAISAAIVFFPTLVNGVLGFRSVPPEMIELMEIAGASPLDVFLRVRIPAALPYLFAAFQIGAAACILGAMIAEWVTSGEGLGYLILQSGVQFEVPLMWAGVVVAALLALTAFAFTGFLARRYASYMEPRA